MRDGFGRLKIVPHKLNTTESSAASDGTLEDRVYYGQNWRNDVSVLVKPDSGFGLEIVEWVKYSAYGVPYCIAAGDYDRSGTTTGADLTAFNADFSASNARADINFDGAVDLTDFFRFANAHDDAGAGGRNVASQASVGNRTGYAGYQWDPVIGVYHVRHRVLIAELGRWSIRDPIGYTSNPSLYSYVACGPTERLDPMGLVEESAVGSGGGRVKQAPCLSCCGPPPCCGDCGGLGNIDGIIDQPSPAGYVVISSGPGPGPPRLTGIVDVLRLECNYLSDPIIEPFGFRHCFVSCETNASNNLMPGWLAGAGRVLITWSLQNTHFFFGKILYIRSRLEDPKTQYAEDDPWTATSEFHVVGNGLCRRAENLGIADQNTNPTRRYKFDSCNSNWYAKAFWFRMLGEAPQIPNAEYQNRCCKSLYDQNHLPVPKTYFGRNPVSFCVNDRLNPGNCTGVSWRR